MHYQIPIPKHSESLVIMSGAEMTIRLVDGSEAEQAAFNRGPDDHETSNVQSVGGVESPNSQRSDTVEAIAAGFATITDKESKGDFQHDTTASVAAMHEQFAAITNGKQDDKPNRQQGELSDTKADGPTTEEVRGIRVALEQLVQRLTPKFFSEPMDRLIAALSPKEPKSTNREPQAGTGLPSQSTGDKAPIIPAVGHVVPRQDEGDAADKQTVDGKPVNNPSGAKPDTDGKASTDIPAVGHVAPKADEKQPDAPKPVSVNDIVSKVQQHIAKIPVVGKRINGAINSVRSTVQKFGGLSKAAKSLKGAIGKTRTGKAFLQAGGKLASKIKGSSFGKAIAGAGRSVVGAVARTVGASAAGGAVVSGGTGAATAVAAGGTAAAGGGAATVAAAAPLLANPVGLAVGAVVASFAVLALATKALNDTFNSEADRLEQYSSAITMAKAKQQISTELNMIGRAKEVGPGLAQFTNMQTRQQDAMQDLWTSILGIMVKAQPVIEVVGDSITALVRGADLGIASLEQVAAALTADGGVDDAAAAKHAAFAGKAFADAVKDIFQNNAPPVNGGDPFLISLLNARP